MKELLSAIEVLEGAKVKDLRVYDFENSSPFYDYFLVCTVNDRQARAVVSYLKKAGFQPIMNVEGKQGWILVDLGDIIVHLFDEENRLYYGFDERLIGFKRIK